MSDLLKALRAAVVSGEIDLSEIDPAYVSDEGQPIKMVVRLNWTVGQKRQRWALAKEGERLLDTQLPEEGDERSKVEAQVRVDTDKWSAGWNEWWAGVILALTVGDEREEVTASSIETLKDSLPWGLVVSRIVEMQGEYEAGTLKKAAATPSPSSEEPASNHPKSGPEPSLPES